MNKDTILESMDFINPKLIEQADGIPGIRRFSPKTGFLVAACIFILLLTTALAGSLFSTPNVNIQDNGSSGVGLVPELDAGTEGGKVSAKLFSDVFLTDVANTPEGEKFSYCFNSWSKMEDYIGYNIFDNPVLDEAKHSYSIYGSGSNEEVESHGYLSCFSKDGAPTGIDIHASYNMNPIEVGSTSNISGYTTHTYWVNVHVIASVFTDKTKFEGGFSSFNFPDGTELIEETYVSTNGRTFTIVRVLVSGSKCPTFYSFLYLDHAYITVMTSLYQSETLALSTMKEILDGFVIE